MKPKKLITLGSYHTDYFLIGDRIPDKGETVTGNYYFTEGAPITPAPARSLAEMWF